MKTLIIHVGTPKCGSSSIQDFFRDNKNCCLQNIRFIKLSHEEANELSQEEQVKSDEFTELFSNYIDSCDTLILSHEMLFYQKNAIKNICKYISSKVSEIIIIGYCRKQSNFLISLYHQIGFRWPTFSSITNDMITGKGIDLLHFSGVEKLMIALIINDFNLVPINNMVPIMNWNDSFNEIEQLLSDYNYTLKVGTLPKTNSSQNLIEDFCTKASIEIRDEYKTLTERRTNLQLNSYLTESIHNAVELELNIIGPENDNGILHEISNVIRSDENFNNEFHVPIMEYIDSYFIKSNQEFCSNYGINQNYFDTPNKYSKDEILEIVRNEEIVRKNNNTMLKRQKELTGIMAEALYNSYKVLKLQSKQLTHETEIQTDEKKLSGLKLLWNKTPEPIRKIGRKILGI